VSTACPVGGAAGHIRGSRRRDAAENSCPQDINGKKPYSSRRAPVSSLSLSALIGSDDLSAHLLSPPPMMTMREMPRRCCSHSRSRTRRHQHHDDEMRERW
jgi:hypothetical protein